VPYVLPDRKVVSGFGRRTIAQRFMASGSLYQVSQRRRRAISCIEIVHVAAALFDPR